MPEQNFCPEFHSHFRDTQLSLAVTRSTCRVDTSKSSLCWGLSCLNALEQRLTVEPRPTLGDTPADYVFSLFSQVSGVITSKFFICQLVPYTPLRIIKILQNALTYILRVKHRAFHQKEKTFIPPSLWKSMKMIRRMQLQRCHVGKPEEIQTHSMGQVGRAHSMIFTEIWGDTSPRNSASPLLITCQYLPSFLCRSNTHTHSLLAALLFIGIAEHLPVCSTLQSWLAE